MKPTEQEIRDAVDTLKHALGTGQISDEMRARLKELIGFCETCQGSGRIWADSGDGTGVPNAYCCDCGGKGWKD